MMFAVITSRCVMPCACMENMAAVTVHSVSNRCVLIEQCGLSLCFVATEHFSGPVRAIGAVRVYVCLQTISFE